MKKTFHWHCKWKEKMHPTASTVISVDGYKPFYKGQCVHVYQCACICAHMHIPMCVCVCACVCAHKCACVCAHKCACTCLFTHVCMCTVCTWFADLAYCCAYTSFACICQRPQWNHIVPRQLTCHQLTRTNTQVHHVTQKASKPIESQRHTSTHDLPLSSKEKQRKNFADCCSESWRGTGGDHLLPQWMAYCCLRQGGGSRLHPRISRALGKRLGWKQKNRATFSIKGRKGNDWKAPLVFQAARLTVAKIATVPETWDGFMEKGMRSQQIRWLFHTVNLSDLAMCQTQHFFFLLFFDFKMHLTTC